MVLEEAVVTHGIEATRASPNGIEAKCASPRWRPNSEIDWHRDRYPRDMINPAGRNHVNRQRSPSSNAITFYQAFNTVCCACPSKNIPGIPAESRRNSGPHWPDLSGIPGGFRVDSG